MPDSSKLLTINQIATPLLAVSAMTALCYFAAPILVPVVTSATLAFILWPGVAALKKAKIPHLLAVIIVMLLAIVLLTIIGMLIYSEAVTFGENVPDYWDRFQKLRTERAADFKAFDFLWQDKGESLISKIDLKNLAAIQQFFFKGVGSVLSFLGQAILRGKTHNYGTRPLDQVLVHQKLENTWRLRNRLVSEGLREHRCERCGNSEWQGEPIPLELHHKDGDRTNNALSNIELLCPNCHAMSDNYRGSKKKV